MTNQNLVTDRGTFKTKRGQKEMHVVGIELLLRD